MNILNSLCGFFLVIGVLVLVHEYGHFLVMRWCGVKVLRSAFGFGKILWSRRDKFGTEWAICIWPLGGYVKPLDTRETSEASSFLDKSLAFNTQPLFKRVAIVIAGPLANLLLAVCLYWVMFLIGLTEWRPILAEPEMGTPAAKAGIHAYDSIIRVDGEPVINWSQVQWKMIKSLAHESEISLAITPTAQGIPISNIDARGVILQAPSNLSIGPNTLQKLGINLISPKHSAMIGQVEPGSPAELAGLKTGDLIQKANGVPIQDWSTFVDIVRMHPDNAFPVIVSRGNEVLTFELCPIAVKVENRRFGRVGISLGVDPEFENYRIQRRFGAVDAIIAAINETYQKTCFTTTILKQMLVGKASIDNLSGPISIAFAAHQSIEIGLDVFLQFLAAVSLSLAVINLLPLPLLDGGYLMYYLIEILTGKQVSFEHEMLLQRYGFIILGSLMFVSILNDLQRIFDW